MIFHTFIHLREAVALLAGHVVDEPTDNFKPEAHSPSVYVISSSEAADLHCESTYCVVVTVDDVAVVIKYLLSLNAVQVFSA
jgi:hypothetical protein